MIARKQMAVLALFFLCCFFCLASVANGQEDYMGDLVDVDQNDGRRTRVDRTRDRTRDGQCSFFPPSAHVVEIVRLQCPWSFVLLYLRCSAL